MMKRIKNKQKKLGNTTKLLVIRLVKRREKYYDIVLSRKRAKPTSRLTRFGYFEVRNTMRENYSVLSLDFKRIKSAILAGAKLHSSLAKILIN